MLAPFNGCYQLKAVRKRTERGSDPKREFITRVLVTQASLAVCDYHNKVLNFLMVSEHCKLKVVCVCVCQFFVAVKIGRLRSR